MRPRFLRGSALVLALLLLSPPLTRVAHAGAGAAPVTLENTGLKRTNQVLSILLAFLKLVDELAALPSGGTMPPPPIGHPGPGPGPLPFTSPGEPPAEMAGAC